MSGGVSLIGSALSVLIYKCIEAAFPRHAHYKQLDMALALQLAHNYFSSVSCLCARVCVCVCVCVMERERKRERERG